MRIRIREDFLIADPDPQHCEKIVRKANKSLIIPQVFKEQKGTVGIRVKKCKRELVLTLHLPYFRKLRELQKVDRKSQRQREKRVNK